MNGKPPARVVFDTNTLLGFLKKYGGYFDVRAIFPDSDLFISEITEIELLSFWNISAQEEAAIVRLLSDVVIIPVLPEIKRETIAFRRASRCRTPDSIIAATAIILDAVLVTQEAKLSSVVYPGFTTYKAEL
jgi:predicted nucleic acid-binding protein